MHFVHAMPPKNEYLLYGQQQAERMKVISLNLHVSNFNHNNIK